MNNYQKTTPLILTFSTHLYTTNRFPSYNIVHRLEFYPIQFPTIETPISTSPIKSSIFLHSQLTFDSDQKGQEGSKGRERKKKKERKRRERARIVHNLPEFFDAAQLLNQLS